MRIIIQLLVIVWTILSLAVSWAFIDEEIFFKKKWKSWPSTIQNIVLDLWVAKNIFISLWSEDNLQIDEKQDNQEDIKKTDTWKLWWSQYLYTAKYAYLENIINIKQIRQLNTVLPNFTDLVWIIKITI